MSVNKQWPSQGIVNVTPTTYPIPQAGDVNWASLTDFLVALANGAQSTTFQRFANRTAISTPVTVTANDCVINTNLTVPGPVAVNLPAGIDKQVYIIADNKFDAATNPVTITPNGVETIGGAANFVMSSNGEGVMLVFQSSTLNWNIAANSKPNPSGGSVGGFTPNISIISDGAGNLTSSSTTATEIGYVSGVTSSIQTQLNAKQPLDADLTAISALATTGLATRTGAGTWDTRTITAGSAKITVADGDGVAANPAIDADEAAFTLDNIGGTLSVNKGGTGVTAVTTVPTATSWAGWDANVNFSANAFIPGWSSTVTTGGTTVLTVSSDELQYFTGTSAQTVTLPVAATLVTGQSFHVVNRSTQNVTVQSSGANTVQVMAGNSFATFTCILASGTTAASWNVEYSVATAGTVTSVDVSGGTTGLTTSGGPVTTSGTITIAGTLIVANGGTGLTSGTSGGVPTFTAPGTLTSSAALTNNQLIVGGGAGAVIKTLAGGTTGQILRMDASGTPVPAWFSMPRQSVQRFTSGSGTYIPSYTFFVSSANATLGATYTNNGFTFTVSQTISAGLILVTTGTGAPAASGTLTRSSGTGDLTITFTSSVQPVSILVEMAGGGGGGGGGASGSSGANGVVGGNSTFGGLVTCNGGGRGGGGGAATSDPGGTATISAPAITIAAVTGQTGNSAALVASGSSSTGGAGGSSYYGGAGGSVSGNATGYAASANTGSGGGGGGTASTSQNQGGAGGSCGGFAKFIIPQALTTGYAYAVGGAGTGGAGGGSAGTGGAGSAGVIVVTEYYI